jgi:hypothetical protein
VKLPEPDSDQYQQGPRESGHDVPQRDGNVVEAGQKAEEAKYKAADDSANQAKAEIANQAKALSLSGNHHPSKTAAYKADGDPNDEVVERWHDGLFPQIGTVRARFLRTILAVINVSRPINWGA